MLLSIRFRMQGNFSEISEFYLFIFLFEPKFSPYLGNVHSSYQHPKSSLWLSNNEYNTAAYHQSGDAGARGVRAQGSVCIRMLRRGLCHGWVLPNTNNKAYTKAVLLLVLSTYTPVFVLKGLLEKKHQVLRGKDKQIQRQKTHKKHFIFIFKHDGKKWVR